MKIFWYGSPEHKEWFAPDSQLVTDTSFNAYEISDHCVVVEANYGERRRSSHLGLQWLQSFRREMHSIAPALVYSFEAREGLVSKFSMLADDMPGISFLRLPFTRAEFKETLEVLTPITQEQLQKIIRWHSGLQKEWNKWAHDLGESLQRWPKNKARAESMLSQWTASIRVFAPDQLRTLEELQNIFNQSQTADPIRIAIKQLEEGLYGIQAQENSIAHLHNLFETPNRPPCGFDAIMIADNQGYELSAIEHLRNLGYSVADVAENLNEADNLVYNWYPQVVLADLNFPSWEEGIELIRRAQVAPSVRLIIAISRAKVSLGDLPDGVEDCTGALDFQDPERIHQIIWRRATSEGIIDYD